ncbi:protein-glutamine gamma-glutamyltransferase 6-like isoform X2 [Bufo bufo]|uniref:protein-glutamine gamma-glutamyltransferase 6-like isoform X2 n=1 Tax=Bufo bufo TaxID=8384 RepID=UPI001ABECD77|nr:protein-glutamine gamma-glutamyltransferase 6-like isoform X2 [Bufo bufo]
MTDVLHLTSVNLNLAQNKLAHHTTDYRNPKLIVRRGQSFVITLKLNRELKPNDTIKFLVEIGKLPEENKIKATFSLSQTEPIRGSWSAVADSLTSPTVNVSITSPVNSIIGSYRLIAQLFSEGFTSHVIGDFILLFNPWAFEDDVYLDNELEREEYVLSDSTIVYYGNEDYIGDVGWNLGQFEDGILKICLSILEKQTAVSLSLLYDPKEVSRVCSAMINSNDDEGVILGNWNGNYAGGVSPLSWTGSVEILRKWAVSGPVRYGQCWVFAGVLCTGIYRLGPTSVKAVKEGDIKLKYDCIFVFSEVNADRISWLYNDEEGSYERVETNISSIGKFTSTKAVGTNDRIDITSHYKYDEGTAEEREVYHNALLQLFGRRNIINGDADTRSIDSPTAIARVARMRPVTSQNIRGNFKDSESTVIGQDVNVILALYNSSASKNIIINFNVKSTGYTRRLMRSVLNDTMSISMEPHEEKEIAFNIPYSKYIDSLTDDKVLEVTALCRDGLQKLLISKVITIQSPSLSIKVLDKAVINNPLNVEITIENPLNETLDECELRVEGSGLVKEQFKRVISMKPKEKTKETVEFTPYMKGSKQLQVVVTNHRIMNFKGYTIINIQDA